MDSKQAHTRETPLYNVQGKLNSLVAVETSYERFERLNVV